MIHLINMHQLALHALHRTLIKVQQSQYLWIESTTLPVCKNQWIQRHRSLTNIVSRGNSSMHWFFGCKLHVIMSQSGEIVRTALSNGHTKRLLIWLNSSLMVYKQNSMQIMAISAKT